MVVTSCFRERRRVTVLMPTYTAGKSQITFQVALYKRWAPQNLKAKLLIPGFGNWTLRSVLVRYLNFIVFWKLDFVSCSYLCIFGNVQTLTPRSRCQYRASLSCHALRGSCAGSYSRGCLHPLEIRLLARLLLSPCRCLPTFLSSKYDLCTSSHIHTRVGGI